MNPVSVKGRSQSVHKTMHGPRVPQGYSKTRLMYPDAILEKSRKREVENVRKIKSSK